MVFRIGDENKPMGRFRRSVAWDVLALGALILAPALVLAACVTTDKYEAAVADAQHARADLGDSEKARQADVAALNQKLADAEAHAQDLAQQLSDLSTSDHNLQAKLDESTAINAQLRGELERLGKNVDAMLQEKGTLAKALDDAKNRLEELRKAQAAAEARTQMFRRFIQKLKNMIDAGQLRVTTRNGRLVIQLPNDVLFDSGQTFIKPAGADALTQLAKVLVTINGRSFQVAGHTDNVPIQTARFRSNWELSASRAVEVVHFLVMRGVAAAELSAAGYAEFDPVASNDTPDGRAKNRRIEISLQPNLDELVAAPDVQ
ncbi:MAG TPA: OmpA family protein [Polyangiaceae bacterium]|nr:OmpA family protein [Polyangiaceae bacterium]